MSLAFSVFSFCHVVFKMSRDLENVMWTSESTISCFFNVLFDWRLVYVLM